MKYGRVWFVLAILLLPAWLARADSGLPPQPTPYPPLRLPSRLAAQALAEGEEIVQLAPMQDAFVANGAGEIRDRNFGGEQVLFVGSLDSDVSELRTLVGYSWPRPEKLLDVQEAVLFFGVGDGAEGPMNVRAHLFWSPFQENRATWNNSAWRGSGRRFAEGSLGEPGYWYGIDVTTPVKDLVENDWNYSGYIGFNLRSMELGYRFYKATLSREYDPELAPQLVMRYRIDNIAPEVWFEGVGEWGATWGGHFFVRGRDAPDPSQPVYLKLEIRYDQGPWTPMSIFGNRVNYPNAPGKVIQMRLRGTDRLGNQSDWVYSPTVKLYSYDLEGRIQDHRERVLPAADPNFSPEPWWVKLHDDPPHFAARLKIPEGLTASPSLPGYGAWQNEPLYRYHSPITITLPAGDNMMPPEEVEDPDAWESNARGDVIERADAGHNGSIQLTAMPNERGPGLFCLKRGYDVGDLNQPTVGLRFWYGLNQSYSQPIWLYWQDEEGRLHLLKEARSKITSYPGNRLWDYAWGDLTPYRQSRGRFCIILNRIPPLVLTPPSLFLDRFSLGSTPSDFSLSAAYPVSTPQPGERFPIDLTVRNHSPYTATGRIHITLDAEPEQKLDLPVMEPDGMFTKTITATMPVSGTLLFQATVGKPEIDHSPADNRLRRFFFSNPRGLYFPLVTRGDNSQPQP